jgi:hypothetical protein
MSRDVDGPPTEPILTELVKGNLARRDGPQARHLETNKIVLSKLPHHIEVSFINSRTFKRV